MKKSRKSRFVGHENEVTITTADGVYVAGRKPDPEHDKRIAELIQKAKDRHDERS